MNIENVEKADHLQLIEVWEASVRATHDFLTEHDLQELKPLILQKYFDAVDLRVSVTTTTPCSMVVVPISTAAV